MDKVLNGRKGHCQINFSWFNEVDNIEYFRNHPWGRLSWETIYKSLDNALYEKDEKFRTTRLERPNHKIEKYNVYGFMSRLPCVVFLFINKFCNIKYLIVVLIVFFTLVVADLDL